jgi:thiol-disulfide isomerase/thioredoxin
MQRSKIFVIAVIALSFVLGACAPAQSQDAMMSEPTAATMMETPTQAAMMEEPTEAGMMSTPTASGMMEQPTESGMMGTPAWLSASLTNVRSGENFTIQDFKGKVVLVETMAIWCTTCLQQEQQVIALHDRLGAQADLVTVGLDVDPNENAAGLKAYAEQNNFDWLFAVASPEVYHEFSDLYSPQFVNPPSAPILIIDRKGEVHLLPFGLKSSDDLYNALQPFLVGTM